MKNKNIIKVLLIILLLYSTDLFALKSRKEYFLKSQIGAWFGPITPIYKTGQSLKTVLGGGVLFRMNTPYRPLKIGLDSSYTHFGSNGEDELYNIPVYMNLIYLLPIDLPVRFQIKAGAGFSYVFIKPEREGQWEPVFMGGFEVSFPAGRLINIGLRIDYIYNYEGYIDGSKRGGHQINSGIMLYFNI